MPVRELVRGLIGALCALAATLILLLCLAEHRRRFGQVEWGVYWLPGKSFSRQFSPIWHPLLVYGAMNMFTGYMLAGLVTTRRRLIAAAIGALTALILCCLIESPLPRLYGKAGWNTVLLCAQFFVFAGAYAGAKLVERWGPAKRHGGNKSKPRKPKQLQ